MGCDGGVCVYNTVRVVVKQKSGVRVFCAAFRAFDNHVFNVV